MTLPPPTVSTGEKYVDATQPLPSRPNTPRFFKKNLIVVDYIGLDVLLQIERAEAQSKFHQNSIRRSVRKFRRNGKYNETVFPSLKTLACLVRPGRLNFFDDVLVSRFNVCFAEETVAKQIEFSGDSAEQTGLMFLQPLPKYFRRLRGVACTEHFAISDFHFWAKANMVAP
jgi:hypothetical protein